MTLRVHFKARRRIDKPRVDVEMVWSAEDWEAVMMGTKLDGIQLEPLEGSGWIDLKIDSLLAEPSVFHFNISVGDETTPVYDSIQRVRFLLQEQVIIPGVFGLTHSWNVHLAEAGAVRVEQSATV
jgi:hypothetical protein